MYLSRVYLDLSNRNTLKAVNSRSVLHGAVEAALTDDRPFKKALAHRQPWRRALSDDSQQSEARLICYSIAVW